jgi:hypothetical protein
METESVTQHSVYALTHPVENTIRYVGVTKKSLRQRLLEHIARANRGEHAPLCHWIRKLSAAGLKPRIVLLEQSLDRDQCERKWIAKLRQEGNDLLNLTDGGDGIRGLQFSAEHKKRIGNALRGRKRPPEISEMLSQVHKGKTLSAETRRKMSEVRKGKKQSEETKAKRRASMIGRTYSAERCANISAKRRRALDVGKADSS